MLRFNCSGDTGGAFEQNDNLEIKVDALDNMIRNGTTFIKLDVEGFEEKALLGAANIIKTYKPKLAVCAYHKSGDIWRLYDLITKMREDYKVFLRHYTQTCFDTVIYFI